MNTIVQQIITCTDVMMTPKPSSVFRASFFLFMKIKLISFVCVCVCQHCLRFLFPFVTVILAGILRSPFYKKNYPK